MTDNAANNQEEGRVVPAEMSDARWLEMNEGVIAEFRSNGGHCGGRWEGNPMVLLTTVGAKSGLTRTSPLTYNRPASDPSSIVLIASKAGADSHPAWYHNLLANPTVTIEIAEADSDVGVRTVQTVARITEEPERSQLLAERVDLMPRFGAYMEHTDRQIPVIVCQTG